MEEEEHMIIMDVKLVTMMQHQEEDEVQKLMKKLHRPKTSTPTRRVLLPIQSVLSLHHFLQSSIPQNLDGASKVTTLAMSSMFFFEDCLLRLQAVCRVARKNNTVDVRYHYTNSSYLGMICTNVLMKPTERITNIATAKFSGLPTYNLWVCVLY